MSWPAYLDTWKAGELERRVAQGLRMLESCAVCPRQCGINRLRDARKLCRVGRRAKVASCFAHFGEEDCLRGQRGSGTIFFSGCNLQCVFCQNWETSNEAAGHEVDAEDLAAMMLELQRQGCHNINFVTPEHVVPHVLEAVAHAVAGGLEIPLIYNTSGYDSLHSLRLLDGVIDIYMPDFKYWSAPPSARFLKARDYPEHTRAALREMHRQVGDLVVDGQGVARRGLLVRHLVMPDGLEEAAEIFGFLAGLSPDTYVNVMDQYRPAGRVLQEPERYPTLGRVSSQVEYQEAVRSARAASLSRLDQRQLPMMLQPRPQL